MPDGNIANYREESIAACNAMHDRLIIWASISVVGGKGGRQPWDSDPTREWNDYTPAQHDAAYALHIMVGQLPDIRHRLVLPEFYRNVEVKAWNGLTPMRRAHIIEHMTEVVNEGIRDYNRDLRQNAPRINPRDFEGIRNRAIHMLVNRERVGNPQQPVRLAPIPLDSDDY